MAHPTIQRIVREFENGQRWGDAINDNNQSTSFSKNAEEYVPFNKREPIPNRIFRNDLNNTTIANLKRSIRIPSANNARNNYQKKMNRFTRVKSTAIPMRNIERNINRQRKSRKSRKNRKSRKSRRLR